jgi:parvulin-like peptidyl-prolyl isomerase
MSASMVDQLKKNLKSSRFTTKSITAIILFSAIILVFVFFGLPSRMGGEAGYAGRVGNKLIAVADLRSESARLEQMYAPMFGGQVTGDAQRQFLQQQALENLIVQEMMNQAAEKAGIYATDPEIQDMIVKDIPVFQRDGHFQRELYYQLLQANHLTPAGFEEKLRKEKRTGRVRELLQIGAEPLQFEIDKLKALHEKQTNLTFAKFDKESVLKTMAVSDAEIKTQLANADFTKRAEAYYKDNQFQFNVEPQAHAQHILIKSDGTPTGDAAALTKIKDIREKAIKGDFQKLAKEFSEDIGSKTKGGDLGFFKKGQMVPEFEKAAFSQKLGEVGEPVKTQFGYHLIKVVERKDGGQKKFDEVKNEIARTLIATDLYEGEVKKMDVALAKGDSGAVDAGIKKLGVKWDETGFFDAAADVVPKLNSQEASTAAFSVSQAHPLFPSLVKDAGARYVIKWKASKSEPGTVKNLSESLERERSYDLMNSWIEQIRKSISVERNTAVLANGNGN